MNELDVEHRYEPTEDTEDRVRRAVSILMRDGDVEREGETSA